MLIGLYSVVLIPLVCFLGSLLSKPYTVTESDDAPPIFSPEIIELKG
jgi:hypothetical protein